MGKSEGSPIRRLRFVFRGLGFQASTVLASGSGSGCIGSNLTSVNCGALGVCGLLEVLAESPIRDLGLLFLVL